MLNLRLETLRGLACILLVLYHVVGSDPAQGLMLADGWLRWCFASKDLGRLEQGVERLKGWLAKN